MRTIERTFNILETVLKQENEIGLAELAQKTGLNIATVRRFCSILVKRGYLYQKKRRGEYSLGLKLLDYNNSVNYAGTIKSVSYPYLEELCHEISETVTLSVLDGIRGRGIAIIRPNQMLQAIPDVESTAPLYCTAVGKLYLAFMPPKNYNNIINNTRFHSFTENTITDKISLQKEIEEIRHDGVAYDDEEFVLGVRSAAAPIKQKSGEVIATISFLSPSIRISRKKMIDLAPVVKKYADLISQSLISLE